MKTVNVINDEDFLKDIKNGKTSILRISTTNCSACKFLQASWEDGVQKKLLINGVAPSDYYLENPTPDIIAKYNIRSVPTTLVGKHDIIKSVAGASTKDIVEEVLSI